MSNANAQSVPPATQLAPRRASSNTGSIMRRSLALLGLALAAQATAETYYYSTIAGVGALPGMANGSQASVTLPLFSSPTGVVVGTDGNLYVADTGNVAIRKVTTAGVVTILAGANLGTSDGTGTAAGFSSPQGPAVDKSGNIYVADFSSSTIRKITPAGVVTTVAGSAGVSGHVNGKSADARFSAPSGVAVDSAGNIYVADTGNVAIRKIAADGTVTTLAGGLAQGGADGTGTAATFYRPRGVAVDSAGNVYVADALNNAIRKITSAGVVTTFVGKTGFGGFVDATGTDARFTAPNALAFDSAGNLYVADTGNNVIRKVTPAGVVTTFAGNGSEGRLDGTGTAARFDHPTGLTVDASGNLYVADNGNSLIRKITAAGVVSTVAGAGGISGLRDGTGTVLSPTLLSSPTGTAVDSSGNVYVADTANQIIRKITSSGVVSTFAGVAGFRGSTDGSGGNFNAPSATAVDTAGNVYVADSANHTVRKVSPAGIISTFAGTAGTAGYSDGSSALFSSPAGVAVDAAGNVYVADLGNDAIRVISPAGYVSTLAGLPGSAGTADGLGGTARFNGPRGVATDAGGFVYVADTGNHAIRKIAPGGMVTTLAGSKGSAGSADGIGAAAKFNGPGAVAVAANGDVFVADSDNNTIRLVTSTGVVTTIGGAAGVADNYDGTGASARFNHPTGIAVDSVGNLYIADNRNHLVRKGTSSSNGGNNGGNNGGSNGSDSSNSGTGSGGNSGSGSSVGTGVFLRPAGVYVDSSGNIYVADTANNSIKRVLTDSTVSTLAGKDGTSGSADGTGTGATFNTPTGITVDTSANLIVCDSGNGTIRKVTTAGVVTTIAGTAGSRGSVNGNGAAARFYEPRGVAVDTSGNIYVADATDATIRKITSSGDVTTIAGLSRTVGDADGVGSAARFNNPSGIAVDSAGVLYVTDTGNNTIRKIATDGTVTTLAGSPGLSGTYDGTGGYALFNVPVGIAIDSAGTLYVADTGNNAIRRVGSTTGITTTYSGMPGISGNRDGTSSTALFNQPQALWAPSTLALYVADTGNSKVRAVTSSATGSIALVTSSSSGGDSGSSSGGGGGGSPSVYGTLALAALLAASRRFRRAA